MNFDDLKKINRNKRVNWFMRHISEPIKNYTCPDLTFAEISANVRFVEDDDSDKFIAVQRTINDYVYNCKRNMYSKASVSISFSEMDHYM